MSSASISPHLHLNHSHHHNHSSTTLPSSFAFFLPFPSLPRLIVLRASATLHGGGVDSEDPSVLRRPVVSPSPLPSFYDEVEEKLGSTGDEDGGEETGKSGRARGRNRRMSDPEWVDWEDKILEDTVPLVGFVRMILHSGKYESGERLSAEHEKAIEERLLAHHPEREKKIGCGIDYITIGYHPDFEGSRCLFIVRKDGELVDFSYWKCIKSLIRKKYPLYADSFILRHFRRRRNSK